MRQMKRVLPLFSVCILLAACGGGGGGGSGGSGDGGGTSGTSTGTFKDANVSGLDYVSGAESGTTNTQGQFTFENNSNVTFSIGGVVLGTTSGGEIITPLEISGNGNLSDTDVANIVRFLLMLDADGNPDNGIEISAAVRSIADEWDQPDFDGPGFDADVSSIVTSVGEADGRTANLPSAAAARDHFERTLRCITAGAFKGTFNGDDQGTFGFLVGAQDGQVSGVAYSELDDELIDLSGSQAVSTDTQRSFASGIIATGGSFEGEFDTPNSISGNWSSPGFSGSFSGERIGGALDAQFRFTGEYGGSDSGLFSFDIGPDGGVTGVAYSVPDDELDSLSGTLNGSMLSANTGQGSTITGTVDTTSGTVSGSWSSSDGQFSGSFSGSGCELNAASEEDGGGNDTGGATDFGETSASAREIFDLSELNLGEVFVLDMAVDQQSQKLIMVVEASGISRIVEGNIPTGALNIISGPNVGSGEPSLSNVIDLAIAHDSVNDQYYVTGERESGDNVVFAVDASTGNRQIVTKVGTTDGLGSDIPANVTQLVYDSSTSLLHLATSGTTTGTGAINHQVIRLSRNQSGDIEGTSESTHNEFSLIRQIAIKPDGTEVVGKFRRGVYKRSASDATSWSEFSVAEDPPNINDQVNDPAIGEGPVSGDDIGGIGWSSASNRIYSGSDDGLIVSVDPVTRNREEAYAGCIPGEPDLSSMSSMEVVSTTDKILAANRESDNSRIYEITPDTDGPQPGGNILGKWENKRFEDLDARKRRLFEGDRDGGSGWTHLSTGTFGTKDLLYWEFDWTRTGTGQIRTTRNLVLGCDNGTWVRDASSEGVTRDLTYSVQCSGMDLTGPNSTRRFTKGGFADDPQIAEGASCDDT